MDKEMQKKLDEYREKRKVFIQGGEPEAVARQHAAHKLTARERVNILLDPGTFVEYDLFVNRHSSDFALGESDAPTEGFITGIGKIHNRPAAICAQDFTILGGSVGSWGSKKMMKIADLALSLRIPLIMINDSGGARPQEQHEVMEEGYCPLFRFHTIASGVIPQITLVMGPVAGGPCYAPALTDFIFMVKGTAHMFIGGPPVVKAVVGEDVTQEELGGAEMHATISGVIDLALNNDEECLAKARELISFLPAHNKEMPPRVNTGDDPERRDESLLDIVPGDMKRPYEMHKVIERIVDARQFFELKPSYAPNLITGLARLNGLTVGIIANQPMVYGGCLDAKSACKGARFTRFCDAFNIPIIHIIDTPAYLVGTQSEREGIIRHGAKMLYAESEATVPVLCVVLRKGYGGAFVAMGSRTLGVADYYVAWPTAELSIFGVDAGMSILLRSSRLKKTLAEAKDQKTLLQSWKDEYYKKYIDLYSVAPGRHVDDIIEPANTRPCLIKALELLLTKKKELPWKKHGNIPL